jgi:hypothetical protein
MHVMFYREPERQGESCLQFCVKFAIMVDNQFKDKLQQDRLLLAFRVKKFVKTYIRIR